MSLTLLLATLVFGVPSDQDLIDKIQAELIEMERLSSHSQYGNSDASLPMRVDGIKQVEFSSEQGLFIVRCGEGALGSASMAGLDTSSMILTRYADFRMRISDGGRRNEQLQPLSVERLTSIAMALFERVMPDEEEPIVEYVERTDAYGSENYTFHVGSEAYDARTQSLGIVCLDLYSGQPISYRDLGFPRRNYSNRGRSGPRIDASAAIRAAIGPYIRTQPWADGSVLEPELIWTQPGRLKVLAAEYSEFEISNKRDHVMGLYWEVTFDTSNPELGFQRVYVDAVSGRPVTVILDRPGGSAGSAEHRSTALPDAGNSVALIGGKRFEITLTNVSKSELESSRPNAALLQGEERIWPVRIDAGKLKGLGFEADFESESELPEAQELEPFGTAEHER